MSQSTNFIEQLLCARSWGYIREQEIKKKIPAFVDLIFCDVRVYIVMVVIIMMVVVGQW